MGCDATIVTPSNELIRALRSVAQKTMQGLSIAGLNSEFYVRRHAPWYRPASGDRQEAFALGEQVALFRDGIRWG
jgi:hypothetical protein